MRISFLFTLLILSQLSSAQIYDDYLGAGNTIGVKVTGSPTQLPDSLTHTVSGTQLKPDLIGASRFLSQAALGASYEDIEYVSDIGIDAWLEEQLNLPTKSYLETYDEIYEDIQTIVVNDINYSSYLPFVFYESMMKRPDVLRQKVAFALSQIFVISPFQTSTIKDQNRSNLVYYDFLYEGAFGNYKDMLTDITLSMPMGNYLSHFMNQKADIIEKTFPDENYAREIMQLFSIGLYELNIDGTPKKGPNGNIPTYDISNIAELAKVFTGLAAAQSKDGLENDNFFRHWNLNRMPPMKMFEYYHAKGEKNILPGVTIPAGQTGMQDIYQTLDILFNHPNVGPFLGRRLIQNLVKSNPTPAYVKRVAMVFNNNGSGVRGDLGAVVKAILLDPEARDCQWIDHTSNGKLIQPMERFITLFKAFDLQSPSGRIWYNDYVDTYEKTGQSFWAAPSVFNFFSPFYAEDEFIAPNDLVSPEFQILNSITAISYINEMENAIKIRPFRNLTKANGLGKHLSFNENDDPFLNLEDELRVYNEEGIDALLDRLNLILCRGQLSPSVQSIIKNTIQQNIENLNTYDSLDAIEDALYYIMMSPNYIIQK